MVKFGTVQMFRHRCGPLIDWTFHTFGHLRVGVNVRICHTFDHWSVGVNVRICHTLYHWRVGVNVRICHTFDHWSVGVNVRIFHTFDHWSVEQPTLESVTRLIVSVYQSKLENFTSTRR